jgi:flagella basal body P-ring formation protein FlgA
MRSLIVLAATLSLLAGPAFAGQAVALRDAPLAHGASVTLGDLFDGAGREAAGIVVAPAPAAGMTTVLDAGRVQLVASAAGLDWANSIGQRRIMVAAGGRAAAASAPAPASPSARRSQALVWSRNIASGEIVQAADLEWSASAVAASDSPGDPDQAIGRVARRPLRAGLAVEARDLASAKVIKRDETISVIFESGGISLALQARALADASVGDRVQVQNLQSKKVIEAVAEAPGRAVVGPRADSLKSQAFPSVRTASLR